MFNLMSFIGSFIVGLVCGISFVASAANLGYSSSQGGATHINSSSRGGAAYIKPSQLQKQNVERQPSGRVRHVHEAWNTLNLLRKRVRQSFYQEGKFLFDKNIDAIDVQLIDLEIYDGTIPRYPRANTIGELALLETVKPRERKKRWADAIDDLTLHEAVQLGNTSGFTARMTTRMGGFIKERIIREHLSNTSFHQKFDQYIDNLHSLALFIKDQPQSKQAPASERQRPVISALLNATFGRLIDQPKSINISEAAQIQNRADGATLLHMALSTSSLNAARLLIQNGANLLQASNSMTPLQQLQEQVKNLKTAVTKLQAHSVWLSGEKIDYMHYSFFSSSPDMVKRQKDIDMFKADEERRLDKLNETSKILQAKAKQGSSATLGDMTQSEKDKKIKDCIQLLQELGVEFKIE